ncbi:hypothetical protein ACFCYH_18710 [Streptomyces sp. NPDC056400]|uniref:hypothetical protein n=1 Tax=Streptomyces sp. NPDC056400 TaxID=3345808 RepID=UPI0035DC6837
MRYIDPPRPQAGGCRTYWSPPRSAYLDLRLLRGNGTPIAVKIDREDDGTAVAKLRDETLRGHPTLWTRWHRAVRAELPAGVARLHPPTRSTRSPTRNSLAPDTDTAVTTHSHAVSLKAQENTANQDRQRITEEKRATALPYPPLIRC